MTYIYATFFCLLAPLSYMALSVKKIGFSATLLKPNMILAVLCGSIFNFAIMSGFLSQSWTSESHNWTPIINILGGVIAIPLYAYLLFDLLKKNASGVLVFIAEGIGTIGLLSAAYLTYASIDHCLFWSDKENSGVMAKQIFQHSDVVCESDLILFKKQGDEFVYRCPVNIVLGFPFGEPFAPWPAYTEGSSNKLKLVYDDFMAQAEEKGQMPGEGAAAKTKVEDYRAP